MKQLEVNELRRKGRKDKGPKEEEWELLGMNSGRYGDEDEEKGEEEGEDGRS